MKKILALFIASISIICAQAQIPKEKTLLWEISGNKIQGTSYLFGTMHLMCADQLKIDEVIAAKFKESKQLFLEIDMSNPSMMMNAIKLMMMPKGESIEKYVGKELYDSMNKIYKSKAGMPLQAMGNVKPMLLMSAIFPALLNCKVEGWEMKFQELAKKQNISIKGLETIEYQMSIFDTIPYSVQANMLKETLFNLDSSRQSIHELMKKYLEKDIDKLYKTITQDAQYGSYEALMLNNRNANWIGVMKKAMEQMPTFFAVGAAHLGGKFGVIHLLRKKGYTVKPVLY
ncbi:MAG: TraB/GumN family protein [Chitinophagaceae bacterium]